MQTITIGASTYTLAPMPATPGFQDLSIDMNDTVAANISPFTRQTQTQVWPGGDWWSAQVTLPPMAPATADAWIAWLAQLRGIANVFQFADWRKAMPRGTGRGAPVVDTSVDTNNTAMSATLHTRGWLPSQYRLLMPRDYLQIGYRLYMCLQQVNSDATGAAQIQVWPSLREQPADATQIVLRNAVGLWRLAKNKRGWHDSPKQLAQMSFECMEAR